jgi:hypothetical protein
MSSTPVPLIDYLVHGGKFVCHDRVRQLLEEELDSRAPDHQARSLRLMEAEANRDWCGIYAEEGRQMNGRQSGIDTLVTPLPIEGRTRRYTCLTSVQRLMREALSQGDRQLVDQSKKLMMVEAREVWREIKDGVVRDRGPLNAREERRRDAARRRRDATELEEERNQPDGIRRREAEWELWMFQRVDTNNTLVQAQETVRLQRQNIPLNLRESSALREQAMTEHRRRMTERLTPQITTTPAVTLPPRYRPSRTDERPAHREHELDSRDATVQRTIAEDRAQYLRDSGPDLV